jgi:hypothetical protein
MTGMVQRPCAVVALALWACACSTSNPATRPASKVQAPASPASLATPPPKPTLSAAGLRAAAQLRELRARLDTVVDCQHTCCAKGYTAFRVPESDEPALREVLTSTEPAPVRGLAAVLLREAVLLRRVTLGGPDIDILPELDRCVQSDQAAGLVPADREPEQTVDVCPEDPNITSQPLSWQRSTLGELCLATANSIAAAEWSREQYRAWRARYPNPRDSLEMWQAIFRSRKPIDQARLADLERHSRDLFVRALLTHPEGLDALRVEPSVVASRLPGVATSAELVGLLENPARWPELTDPQRREAFARNLLVHWRVLLGVEAAPRLEALWDSGYGQDMPVVRSDLAWAIADAIPARRRAILEAGLTGGIRPDRILERLATEYASGEQALLMTWFSQRPADPYCQEAILRGLAHADPPPRHLFRLLLGSVSAADGWLMGQAAATARSLGCKLPATVCENLSPPVGKIAMDRNAWEEEQRRAQQEQHKCLAELRRQSSRW